jgi:hypothetical protein
MIIPAMKYLGLRIDKLVLITLKTANKQVVTLKGIINNVIIAVMRGFHHHGFPCGTKRR